jgi:tetratricopeptide (TPR) repeat protein
VTIAHACPLVEGERLQALIHPIIPRFQWLLRRYALFHIGSWSILGFEGLFILLSFTFLAQSMLMAFALSVFFLTLFSYLMLRLYFQAVKPEQMLALKDHFIESYKSLTHYQEEVPEHLLGLSQACCQLSDALSGSEYQFFYAPDWLKGLKPFLEKWSCWWQWQEVHQMRELLLQEAVAEHIKLVRCEPTHPEAHAALANAYVLLSILYTTPLKRENSGEWLPSDGYLQSLDLKFRKTAKKAIEEFQILCDYAPNDPWVHLQLAYSYHDLGMPQEEIREYETILHLQPDDLETRFKLGSLYFQQEMNAKGLRIYEELRRADPKRAEALIRLFGAE